MAWSETSAWIDGEINEPIYHDMLQDAATAHERDAGRRKIVRPAEMPWEMSRQGLLKHLIHERMNTRMETVDAYMQIIPSGSRSGRHRHLSEECLYVLEGRGYDLHQDCDLELTDKYEWKPQEEIKRFDWEAGDVVYVPPNTIHQHFNADPDRVVRLISSTNRIFKYCGLNNLEQLEDAPEYLAGRTLTPELVRAFLRGDASRRPGSR